MGTVGRWEVVWGSGVLVLVSPDPDNLWQDPALGWRWRVWGALRLGCVKPRVSWSHAPAARQALQIILATRGLPLLVSGSFAKQVPAPRVEARRRLVWGPAVPARSFSSLSPPHASSVATFLNTSWEAGGAAGGLPLVLLLVRLAGWHVVRGSLPLWSSSYLMELLRPEAWFCPSVDPTTCCPRDWISLS